MAGTVMIPDSVFRFMELERYNIFHVEMLVRHDADGKRYLYDVVNIKKETGTPLEQ